MGQTGKAEWLNATKFWMKLLNQLRHRYSYGLILEFQFGSNWSNYSWFVGGYFRAPLAIEGLFAFFGSHFAVMFFRLEQGKPSFSSGFHLMVFIGSNISALWILVAHRVDAKPGRHGINPMTARNEMSSFWAVLTLHRQPWEVSSPTVTSAYTLSACFVVGGKRPGFVLKKDISNLPGRRSILLASVFGFPSIIATIFTGDISAQDVTRTQPMKLAAMEGLNEGGKGSPVYLDRLDLHRSSITVRTYENGKIRYYHS